MPLKTDTLNVAPATHLFCNIKTLKNQAKQNSSNAQALLGYSYYYGYQVTMNKKQGEKWLRQAAQYNDAAGIWAQGLCLLEGIGINKDSRAAINYFFTAAQENYAPALCSMGRCYFTGLIDGRQNLVEAEKYYLRATKLNYLHAIWGMGCLYGIYAINVQKKFCEIVQCYTNTAKADASDDTTASYNMRNFYVLVEAANRQENLDKMIECYMHAAKQGYAAAQCSLGCCYQSGLGVKQDIKRAIALYRQSAKQGYARGAFMLGVCYEQGIGVAPNQVEAIKWYKEAEKQGHPLALSHLEAMKNANPNSSLKPGQKVKISKEDAEDKPRTTPSLCSQNIWRKRQYAPSEPTSLLEGENKKPCVNAEDPNQTPCGLYQKSIW